MFITISFIVTSMPIEMTMATLAACEYELTTSSSMEYESIDSLNKLPFSQLPNDLVAEDFDDSVDYEVTEEVTTIDE